MRGGALAMLGLALSACTGPRPPLATGATVVVPTQWRSGGSASRAVDARWWEQFRDPALNALVERALAGNVDLLVAGARIREARARFDLAASRAKPSVDLEGGGGESRSVNAFGRGLDQTQASGEVALAWEADLFGRLAAMTDAQRQALKASGFARDAVRVALISTMASGYVGLLALDERLRIASDTVASRTEELAVVRRRASSGYASTLDLARAQAELEAAERLVPAGRLAVARQESALSVLLGAAPGPIARAPGFDGLQEPAIPASLPSETLRQRPDVAEAEARIVAADRDLDAARAAFMPRIRLSASVGGVVSTALAGPIGLFSLGGSVLAPLFEGGALRADADAAAARRDQAAFAYRGTVLAAFREVEDAMAGVDRVGEERDAAVRRLAFVRTAFDLSRRRYRAGYASYLDQLDAERSLLDAQLALVDLRLARLDALIALDRSLGGGWRE